MPSDVERAWVAGLLDGDGCITMNPNGRLGRKPCIAVDNTDVELLEELVRLYGGRLVAKKRTKEHHRQAWSWRVYGSDRIIEILSDVLPFMRCKMKVERGRMLTTEFKSVTPRNGWYTPEMREKKRDFERRFMAIGLRPLGGVRRAW
jgi:hypothetical protein